VRDEVRLKAVAAASNNHRQVRELSNQAEGPTRLDRQRAAGPACAARSAQCLGAFSGRSVRGLVEEPALELSNPLSPRAN